MELVILSCLALKSAHAEEFVVTKFRMVSFRELVVSYDEMCSILGRRAHVAQESVPLDVLMLALGRRLFWRHLRIQLIVLAERVSLIRSDCHARWFGCTKRCR